MLTLAMIKKIPFVVFSDIGELWFVAEIESIKFFGTVVVERGIVEGTVIEIETNIEGLISGGHWIRHN